MIPIKLRFEPQSRDIKGFRVIRKLKSLKIENFGGYENGPGTKLTL